MTTLCCILAQIVRGPAAVGSSHTAIRMAPFNMAGVAGLLATCAAVAASAAHLLPLLLLLICPRGTQAEQGKTLSRSDFPSSFRLPCVGLIELRDDSPQRHLGSRCIAPIATLGCILSQMYRVRQRDRSGYRRRRCRVIDRSVDYLRGRRSLSR